MTETYIVVREFSYVGRWQRRGQEWVPRGHKWDAWYIARGYVEAIPADESNDRHNVDKDKSLEEEQISAPESEQLTSENVDDIEQALGNEQIVPESSGDDNLEEDKPKPKRKRGRPRKRQREE